MCVSADSQHQCDGTRPICQRCTKARRICLQTTAFKRNGLLIHDENHYASGKNKRPRGPRTSLTVLRPELDLQTRAFAYYLVCHVQTVTDLPNISGGLPESVASWRDSGKTCPMVDLALSSMALAVFSRTQRHPPAATEASSKYQSLLRLTQERIAQLSSSSFDGRGFDACLLTISLMGRYEGVIYYPGNNPALKHSFISSSIWSHHNGAMAILRFWYYHVNRTPATTLIRDTRRGLIRSSLLRNIKIPDWMLDGFIFGERHREEDYDRIFVRTVNLQYASASLQHKDYPDITEIERLSNEAGELDKALKSWVTKFPDKWSYQRHILKGCDPQPNNPFYSPVVYSYSSPGYAAVWNQSFALGMLINRIHLKILGLIRLQQMGDSTFEPQRETCAKRLRTMADSLASSLPFCLEKFRVVDNSNSPSREPSITFRPDGEIKPYLAVLAVWPLSVASIIDGIDFQQQQWFKSQLAGIGKITGEGVLESVKTDEWVIL